MHKKGLYFFLAFICLTGSFFIVFSFRTSQNGSIPVSNTYCPFCDMKVLNSQKFYEDELVTALYTHKPIYPGHCLIIPKRHSARFEMLTDEEILQMGRVIKKVHLAATKVFKTSSYLLLQKNGREVGQSVFHVHFHYIPRMKNDDSIQRFLFNMFLASFKNPISSSAMQEAVNDMRAAMDQIPNP